MSTSFGENNIKCKYNANDCIHCQRLIFIGNNLDVNATLNDFRNKYNKNWDYKTLYNDYLHVCWNHLRYNDNLNGILICNDNNCLRYKRYYGYRDNNKNNEEILLDKMHCTTRKHVGRKRSIDKFVTPSYQNEYRFGNLYNYYDTNSQFYCKAKYKSLKDELTNNLICTITMKEFAYILEKVKEITPNFAAILTAKMDHKPSGLKGMFNIVK